MTNHAFAEKRSTARYSSDGLVVQIRRKGRITHLDGLASDFNAFGLAVVLDQPLTQDSTVFLTLMCGSTKITDVVAVVHNCVSLEHGYRCGLQFRTNSGLQSDCRETEKQLRIMESRFKVMGHTHPQAEPASSG